MSWTGSPSTNEQNGSFAAAQAANDTSNELQNRRAARVVAGRAIDVDDCAEMLAMLGLDAGTERVAAD
ncbi:hypothetical protein [Pseudonocardia sp.]|uniref:hypothetical protein n=1 Tax=Pseudonocardia sp. TaxID=60912 RepID=UPI002615D35B|nr:hypothetical protein [Pseudonocardia sp.]